MATMSDRDRLRRVRLEQDLTYRALAARLGISTMALHNYLNSHTEPTERTQYKIRQYLDGRGAR